MIMRFWSLAFVLLTALVASDEGASASSFMYDGYTVANEQNIQIYTPNNIYGGAGQVTLIGSGADSGETIPVWCLDIYTYLLGSDTYQLGLLTTAGAGGSSLNTTLTLQQIGEIGALIVHGNSLINTSPDVSAAVQLAIWQVEYADFTYSGFDSGAVALAAIYLNDASQGIWSPVSNVSLLSEGFNNQSMAFVTPLPSTWLMLLGGLVGLCFFAWRGSKQNAAAVAAV
jgi:hypothetical protein